MIAQAAISIPSTPDLGKAEGACRPQEPGPAFLVHVHGLKDHAGRLKLEVYPPTDGDFLADDNILVSEHKVFRRVEVPTPASVDPVLCIRVPAPGAYALTLLHDRDSNRKFSLSIDGIGFSANPRLGWSKPRAATVRVEAGAGLTPITIVLNYRRGLFGFAPLEGSGQ
jgi:uncharacterized protein (DUF2141 family)